ncbi:helix-turn-helix domain-containing protein [Pseudomonas sp. RIT-To-2]|uniref:helix-turn-helix domain-containing protein n=1 Tax=Pseudomonas sp. RIT-To-2 TaxID=3462541 RepID=UPI0024138C5F
MRHIACLLYPGVMSLDVTGPLQVFASANEERARLGLPSAYTLHLLAESTGPVVTSAGFALHAEHAFHATDPSTIDTLLVPGGQGEQAQFDNQPLLQWLRDAEPRVRRLGSICSGALILAHAGLLDGYTATTHWADVEALRAFPRIQVQGERLHTYQPSAPHLFTSAGVTAGIDLALALLEDDLGRTVALAVARRLVMFLKRPGDQAQFSPHLAPEASRAPRLAALLEWIPAHLGDDLSLEALAEQACMAPRTLYRVFTAELGTTPARYVEQVRLASARALLHGGQASVQSVARLCGFGHPESLRRSFQKTLGISPQHYAERFG